MQLDRHYTDELLVAIYDIENSGREDIDFYLRLADELDPAAVTDLGCGTGVLACDLAAAGRRTTGVDPAAAMLAFARSRPGGDRVEWIQGEASALPTGAADLVVMTGHVAQVFLTDDDWDAALTDCQRALRPGGHVAFEVRNPESRAWQRWNKQDTFDTYPLPDGGYFQSWVEVTGEHGPLVDFEGHNLFSDRPDSDFIVTSTLRFRTQAEVHDSLTRAGFEVADVFGNWDRSPVTPQSPELIFLARRH